MATWKIKKPDFGFKGAAKNFQLPVVNYLPQRRRPARGRTQVAAVTASGDLAGSQEELASARLRQRKRSPGSALRPATPAWRTAARTRRSTKLGRTAVVSGGGRGSAAASSAAKMASAGLYCQAILLIM